MKVKSLVDGITCDEINHVIATILKWKGDIPDWARNDSEILLLIDNHEFYQMTIMKYRENIWDCSLVIKDCGTWAGKGETRSKACARAMAVYLCDTNNAWYLLPERDRYEEC